MNTKSIEDIAAAVLYEGYLLYPYRASAIKNRQRWNFGVLYPPSYVEQHSPSDSSRMQLECLLRARPDTVPRISPRFLHLIARTLDGQEWQGAMPREFVLQPWSLTELFETPKSQEIVYATQEDVLPLAAVVDVEAVRLGESLYKLRVSISNTTGFTGSTREQALMQSLVSSHVILTADRGKFVSLLDPPEELRDSAASCQNVGVWPVLAGDEGQGRAMLASPIILYDYPKIAPESPGALFDGTEIDEILTLRIMTLTDDEKRAMTESDERAREILERTERLSPEEFMKMHGVFRNLHDAPLESS